MHNAGYSRQKTASCRVSRVCFFCGVVWLVGFDLGECAATSNRKPWKGECDAVHAVPRHLLCLPFKKHAQHLPLYTALSGWKLLQINIFAFTHFRTRVKLSRNWRLERHSLHTHASMLIVHRRPKQSLSQNLTAVRAKQEKPYGVTVYQYLGWARTARMAASASRTRKFLSCVQDRKMFRIPSRLLCRPWYSVFVREIRECACVCA